MLVYRLPMRNWNRIAVSEYGDFIRVYRLPMRNWNQRLHLDRHSVFTFIDYLWGIETIKKKGAKKMEGLFIDYLWGIETIKIQKISKLGWKVYRLPMRNWNNSLLLVNTTSQ